MIGGNENIIFFISKKKNQTVSLNSIFLINMDLKKILLSDIFIY